jgi:hypothetical protein
VALAVMKGGKLATNSQSPTRRISSPRGSTARRPRSKQARAGSVDRVVVTSSIACAVSPPVPCLWAILA